MRRTKTVIPVGEAPLWRNLYGTYTTKAGRTYGPGEYFRAEENEIPKLFRDSLERVEEKKPEPPRFEIRKRSTGWYDVFDLKTQTPVNEQALRKQEAEELYNQKTKP